MPHPLEFNSIRSRMVIGFLFLTLLILVLALVSLSIIDRVTRIADVHATINQLEVLTLNLLKSDNDFFDQETTNENYFQKRESHFLHHRDSLNKLINREAKELIKRKEIESLRIPKGIEIIDSMLHRYNTGFHKLENLVYKKGFKDYGTEGAMRRHAHALEEWAMGEDMLSILNLRRHEKDFLLRNDTSYLQLFRQRADELVAKWSVNHARDSARNHHLLAYRTNFFILAGIHLELGLTGDDGLRNELNLLTNRLSSEYYLLTEYSSREAKAAYSSLRLFYVILLVCAITFSLLSGYWISKRLSEPIAHLSRVMGAAIRAKTLNAQDLRISNAAQEIHDLADSFTLLVKQLRSQMGSIRDKSRLLRVRNKELRKVNREMDNFLYSTAHDLRSPLTSLLGLINLMRLEKQQVNLALYLDMMEKSIHRCEHFISQIVSLSKNKGAAIQPEPLDMQAIIYGIFDDQLFIEGASRIRKMVSVHGDTDFHSDKNRVTIIFNNLISNAIKYSDPDKSEPFIRINIHIHFKEARIDFSDNGLGIGKEHIANIFKMFYRAHHHSKGSGLGLFIFKETLNKLNGEAVVESDPGIGTTFSITLPNLINGSKENFEHSGQDVTSLV